MDSKGRGEDGGFRVERGRRSVRNSGRRGRKGDEDRRNEPGEASSQQTAIQDHSLHPSPSKSPEMATRTRPLLIAPAPYIYVDTDTEYYNFMGEINLPVLLQREVQPQTQGQDTLKRGERHLASARLFDSAGTAREEPDISLRLGSSAADQPMMKRKRSTKSTDGCHEHGAPPASNNISIREQQPSSERSNPYDIDPNSDTSLSLSLGSKRRRSQPESFYKLLGFAHAQ